MKIRKTIVAGAAIACVLCSIGATCLSTQAVVNKEEHGYSIKDVTVLQLYCAEQCAIPDDSEMFNALNVNLDNSLNMTDALLIQLKISELFDFRSVYGKRR
ncbi:hypothetical protein [Ruminococcus sp.]|uniref:hypothetical protein n=1 Tax=Ruminococcus sp. TaxID=41978 RepID=UPI002E7A9F7F|nr:hypothetical protein [Ruminococcus sp.]MEE1264647.1 hypothetical protein [Ruminococcus sp.]